MAIAFDNVATATAVTQSFLQWTHTVSGANTYMNVGIASSSTAISAVYANNVSMTKVGGLLSTPHQGAMYTKAGVAAAALTMSAQTVGGGLVNIVAGSVSYNGVSQAAPDSGNASSQTVASATVQNFSVGTTAGQTVFAVIGGASTTFTSPAGQTRRYAASASSVLKIAGDEKASSGTTTSFSWSETVGLATFNIGIGFSATASGVVVNPAWRNLTGVGK